MRPQSTFIVNKYALIQFVLHSYVFLIDKIYFTNECTISLNGKNLLFFLFEQNLPYYGTPTQCMCV